MRNVEPQSLSEGNNKWTKHFKPCFDWHTTDAPLTRALERINGKITKIELAWEAYKQTRRDQI